MPFLAELNVEENSIQVEKKKQNGYLIIICGKKLLENVFTVGKLHVLTWIQIDCSINAGATFACEEH